MTTRNSRVRPIPLEIKAGVRPYTDSTALSTDHYVMTQGIRMFNGVPRKIGGWQSIKFTNGNQIQGYVRSLYSTVFDARPPQLLIGSNEHLYNLSGTVLTNITPAQENFINNTSVATHYYNLSGTVLTTTNGSRTIQVFDPNLAFYRLGDTVTFNGATGFNGISATLLNAPHVIRAIGTNFYSFDVNDMATASGNGTGSFNVASGLLTITKTAHGLSEGDRVKTENITAVGGITALQANGEFIIRNTTANTFDYMTTGTSTSQTSNTTGRYYPEIPAGPSTEYTSQGYGAGLYGTGLYGASGTSNVARITPRIWFFDKFGEKVIMNCGDKIYEWAGQSITAPNILVGAPDEVAYIFVSDNILVTLGAGGVGNHIFASDQGNAANFVASSENQVFEDYIEGSSALISHAPANGQNLLFSETQTYTFRYIGKDAGVWQIKKIDDNVGIIAPLARVSVGGVPYWMGTDNFYRFRGGNVEIIPANTQSFTTLLNYVFDNINRDQLSKCFAWFNQKYNEVWFHYPTADSEEPNAVARVSLTDNSWVPDMMPRTAAEQTSFYFNVPHLANISTLYEHEVGYNADGEVLPWMIKTNLRSGGKDSTMIVNIVPDSIQNGNINVMVENYRYPGSSQPIFQQNYKFKDTDENIPVQLDGHFWQYTITGDVLDQNWVMGQWYEYVQGSSPE